MRHYETTYILRPNLGEEQFTEIIERTNAIITGDGGTIIEVDRWGLKKLAYEIKKETQGLYIYLNYAAPGTTIKEIERIFRIDDRLLRYLTIKLADSIDAAGIDEEIEKIATQVAEEEAARAEETAAADADAEEKSETAPAESEEKVQDKSEPEEAAKETKES